MPSARAMAEAAEIVWLRGDDDETSLAPASGLAALGEVARTLEALHARGHVHGDLRPELVRYCPERGSVLMVPERTPDAPELLRQRLAAGAPPETIAFVAPEVVRGGAATLASDVYSLAALVFASVTGRPALGLVDGAYALAPLTPGVAAVVLQALHPLPAARPSMASLARAIEAALLRPDPAPSDRASLLGIVLAIGASAVFTGVLGVSVARWSSTGAFARFALAAAFTLATFAAGRLLMRRGSPRSGRGLVALGAALLWADAWLLLAVQGAERELAAWAIASAIVAALQAALAVRMRSLLLGSFAVFALSTSALTIARLVPMELDLGAAVYAGALGALHVGGAFASARHQRDELSLPLCVAATVWLCASSAVSLLVLERSFELVALLWPYAMAAGCYALGSRAPDRVARSLSWVALSCLVAAPALQPSLLLESDAAIHASAVVTLLLAALAAGTLRTSFASITLSLHAWCWTALSASVSLLAFAREPSAGHFALPYVLAALHAAVASVAGATRAAPVARMHLWGALAIFSLAPSVHALALGGSLPVVVVAAFGVVTLAFGARSLGALVVGLCAATIAPVAALLAEAFRAEGPGAPVAIALAVSLALTAVALGRTAALGRQTRRALELFAVGIGPGMCFLLSLADVRDDIAYATLMLVSAGALLMTALWSRRLALGVASAATLLAGLTVHYFAKLSETVHWGLCAAGFGVVLLVSAAIWERQLRPLLAPAERWQ